MSERSGHRVLQATCIATALGFGVGLAAVWAEEVDPFPRPVLVSDPILGWEFQSGLQGWEHPNQCSLKAEGGSMLIGATGEDAHVESPAIDVQGPVMVELRMRSEAAGRGELFWMASGEGRWTPERVERFPIQHDGQWHAYRVFLDTADRIVRIRLDPGSAPGRVEVDRIGLRRARRHPLAIESFHVGPEGVDFHVRNHGPTPLGCSVNGRALTLAPSADQAVHLDVEGRSVFEPVEIVVSSQGLPPLRRSSVAYRPQGEASWVTVRSGPLALEVSADGHGARIRRNEQVVALIAPLVQRDGKPVPLEVTRNADSVQFRGDGVEGFLKPGDRKVDVRIESREPCEGPVLRALGGLEQGLLPGVDYLGKGETSSSRLDFHTADHLRFEPDPLLVTMPLMACVTEQATVAMAWRDMTLQPVFAAPNFLDGTADHRMALKGKRIEATLLIRAPAPLDEAILWGLQREGLPPLPKPPRTALEQNAVDLWSLTNAVAGPAGWGHAAEARWERRPYVDMVSILWRLGQPRALPDLVSGGSHLRNDAGYFLTGHAAEWLALRRSEAQAILREQQPDGSFRYKGKYAAGHHEDTASGYCAFRAMMLLEYARLTGDKASRDGGLRALAFMKRFRTPRGAQTHELPLHSPDLLGAAYLVWSNVRGYELTGDPSWLAAARKWALSGVPFVYQWGDRPIMAYATIAALGATDWQEPNWLGLPVQWCGAIYAYALTMLAPYDTTVDWKHLARGILITAEQMQYPDGPVAGCLPDFFSLSAQRRGGPSLNPCVLVSLRLALAGEPDALSVASNDRHRVVAPFPVAIEGTVARIRGREGTAYQALVDGQRVVDVRSRGVDEVPLSADPSEAERSKR